MCKRYVVGAVAGGSQFTFIRVGTRIPGWEYPLGRRRATRAGSTTLGQAAGHSQGSGWSGERDGRIDEYEILPGEFGMAMTDLDAIRVDSPGESKAMLLGVLDDREGPARDIVLLNAGAALYAAGVAGSIADGIGRHQTPGE